MTPTYRFVLRRNRRLTLEENVRLRARVAELERDAVAARASGASPRWRLFVGQLIAAVRARGDAGQNLLAHARRAEDAMGAP